MANHVYSTASIMKPKDDDGQIEEYQLGTFLTSNVEEIQNETMLKTAKLSGTTNNGGSDPLLEELQKLTRDMGMMKVKLTTLKVMVSMEKIWISKSLKQLKI